MINEINWNWKKSFSLKEFQEYAEQWNWEQYKTYV